MCLSNLVITDLILYSVVIIKFWLRRETNKFLAQNLKLQFSLRNTSCSLSDGTAVSVDNLLNKWSSANHQVSCFDERGNDRLLFAIVCASASSAFDLFTG